MDADVTAGAMDADRGNAFCGALVARGGGDAAKVTHWSSRRAGSLRKPVGNDIAGPCNG
jgi:hypothetical protein